MPSAQSQLAAELLQIEVTGAERARLATCILDFSAAVLVGAGTPLGKALVRQYASERDRGFAFCLSYLAEISEYSHGHIRMAGHLGSTVLPTVLALASQHSSSSADWNAAALAGYEAFARVGQALMPDLERWGSGSTGVSGAFGAAAAAAYIHGADANGLSAALGNAAYLAPLTPIDAYLSGTNSAEAAAATTTGMLAAELVQLGAHGSPQILDELHHRIVGQPPEPAFAGDGTDRLAVHRLYFKPYPTCRFTHGPLQAALGLLERGVAAPDIEQLTVWTTPRAVRACGHIPELPRLGYLDRQFSIPYLVSLALLQQRLTTGDILNPPANQDEAVLDFAEEHVQVKEDLDLVRYGTICPTILQMRLRDGSIVEHCVNAPRGCPEAPMTAPEIEEKFRQIAEPMLGSAMTEDWHDLAQQLAWPDLGQHLGLHLRSKGGPQHA